MKPCGSVRVPAVVNEKTMAPVEPVDRKMYSPPAPLPDMMLPDPSPDTKVKVGQAGLRAY